MSDSAHHGRQIDLCRVWPSSEGRGTEMSKYRGVRTIWTIGHSNHAPEAFVSLLQANHIRFVIDVRSAPQSRIAPQYDRRVLQEKLQLNGIKYAFFGDELGGRPPERELYDLQGRVLYWAVAKLGRFREAIERLVTGSGNFRIAIMCAEEDPLGCHRRLLVGRVLTQRGVLIKHLRGDGRVEEEQIVDLLSTGPLIGAVPSEERDWKSIRSVLRARPPKSFSTGSVLPGPSR